MFQLKTGGIADTQTSNWLFEVCRISSCIFSHSEAESPGLEVFFPNFQNATAVLNFGVVPYYSSDFDSLYNLILVEVQTKVEEIVLDNLGGIVPLVYNYNEMNLNIDYVG